MFYTHAESLGGPFLSSGARNADTREADVICVGCQQMVRYIELRRLSGSFLRGAALLESK